MPDRHDYRKLAQSSNAEKKEDKSQSWTLLSLLAGAAVIAFLSSGLTILIISRQSCPTTSIQHSSETSETTSTALKPFQEPPRLSCGSSVEEALAAGCTFDPLSIAWLPSYCPRDALDLFEAAAGNGTKWRYWMDKDGTHELQGTAELALIGPKVMYWTTIREHLNHCMFMLLRVHLSMTRAREGDVRVDATTRSFQHAKHCAMVLYKKAISEDDERIGTTGEVAFGSC